MAKENKPTGKPAGQSTGKASQNNTVKDFKGKVVNLRAEERAPAAIPPKMELKPPKK